MSQRELSFFLAKTLPARPELCCGCWVFGPCVIACSVFGVCGGFWGVKNGSERGVSLCPLSSRRGLESRFRLSVVWVLLLSCAACAFARDGAWRTLLLVSVEVSEARSSMSTIDVDTVHSDERTISLVVIFVFIIYVRFIGIFYYPETPS